MNETIQDIVTETTTMEKQKVRNYNYLLIANTIIIEGYHYTCFRKT